MRRGSARARVRRATAAAWDTLTMNRAPLQVRARTAGADRRRARRTCAAGPVHASREGAALREQRSTGQGYAHAGVTRVPRAAGSKGPAEAQAGQWSKPRTAREGEKLCVRTTGAQPRCWRGPKWGAFARVTSRALRAVRQGVVGKRPPTHPPHVRHVLAGHDHPPMVIYVTSDSRIGCGAKYVAHCVIQRSCGLRSIICICTQPAATAARRIAPYKGRNHRTASWPFYTHSPAPTIPAHVHSGIPATHPPTRIPSPTHPLSDGPQRA